MSLTLKAAIQALKGRIADAYTAISQKGGTLPATQDSANLPTAIASIPGRGSYDIISGVTLADDPTDPTSPTYQLPDGCSLSMALFSNLLANTKILVDAGTGWTLSKTFNIQAVDVLLRCKYASAPIINTAICTGVLDLPDLEYFTMDNQTPIIENCTAREISANSLIFFYQGRKIYKCPNVEKIYLNSLEYAGGWNYTPTIQSCPLLREIYAENYHAVKRYNLTPFVQDLPELRKLSLGIITEFSPYDRSTIIGTSCPKLLDFRVGSVVNLDIRSWNPTYVLSDNPSGTDLIPEGSTAASNLDQFLINFRDHIANRLSDRTGQSSLTLTLSQGVRDAIHAAEATYGIEDIIITQKHWTIAPAPTA